MANKKRKSPLKGKIASKIRSDRSVDHLDPHSKIHAEDKKNFSAVREIAKKNAEDVVNVEPTTTLKYPSLQGGICLGKDGRRLTPKQHSSLLKEIRTKRSYYLSVCRGRNGDLRKRKRKTNPLSQLAVTFRPDYAMAFSALENQGSDLLINFVLQDVSPLLINEFEVCTGLEVVAVQVHPEEGALHLHITYASVCEDFNLLWAKPEGRGRRGLRLLGPSGVAMIRLASGGIIPDDWAGGSKRNLRDRLRSTGGDTPVDLCLAETLDGLCALLFSKDTLKPFWEKSFTQYTFELEQRLRSHPRCLQVCISEMRQLLDEKDREIEKLRRRPAALNEPLSTTLDASFKDRLKGLVPAEILRDADMFCDVIFGLMAIDEDRGIDILRTLGADERIALLPAERNEIYSELQSYEQRSEGRSHEL